MEEFRTKVSFNERFKGSFDFSGLHVGAAVTFS